MADHREQVRGDTPPGALAKAVIFTTEPVGSACMRFAGDQREQVRGDTPPGALAKAVTSTIEAVGTPPIAALTNGGWGDKIRIYIFI